MGPSCLMMVASKHCAECVLISVSVCRCLCLCRSWHGKGMKCARTEPVPAAGFMRAFPAMLTAFQSLRTSELASSCICVIPRDSFKFRFTPRLSTAVPAAAKLRTASNHLKMCGIRSQSLLHAIVLQDLPLRSLLGMIDVLVEGSEPLCSLYVLHKPNLSFACP